MTLNLPKRLALKRRFSVALLWLVAVVGTAHLMLIQYRALEGATPISASGATGGDFFGFLHAARQIASGHSPYDLALIHEGYGYVYSPLVAVLLLPFRNFPTESVWHLWTALSVVALVVFGALVTMAEAHRMTDWRRPVLFGFTMIATFHFGPVVSDLSNGQTDALVLVAFALAVLSSERGWRTASGALIGVGAVIKTWPAVAVLNLLRRGYVDRRKAAIGFAAALCVAPILALAIGGWSTLRDFLKITFDALAQRQVSFSVWGVPKLLFTSSGLSRPIVVSGLLRDVATLVLLVWVIALIVMTLRWADSSVLGFWNVVACVTFLLPISHFDYSMYLLPLLWIWAARVLAVPRLFSREMAIGVFLGLWWLLMFRTYWEGVTTLSSLQTSRPFFFDICAVTISVLGDHLVRGRTALAVEGRPLTTSACRSVGDLPDEH